MIDGFEAAWAFFGGVFAVVIPDNMKAIVDKADAIDPKLNDAFREYAQARGFAVDPARIRSPRDKPRVERMCSVCEVELLRRGRLSESGRLPDAGPSSGVGRWRGCGCTAPPGVARPRCSPPTSYPSCKPVPDEVFDIPTWTRPKVAPDRHVQVAKALYSVPGELVGRRLDARVDARTVKLYLAR